MGLRRQVCRVQNSRFEIQSDEKRSENSAIMSPYRTHILARQTIPQNPVLTSTAPVLQGMLGIGFTSFGPRLCEVVGRMSLGVWALL